MEGFIFFKQFAYLAMIKLEHLLEHLSQAQKSPSIISKGWIENRHRLFFIIDLNDYKK